MRRWCSWAGCRNPATAEEDGFDHCRPHLAEHRRQMQDEAAAARVTPITTRREVARCGTRSGFSRHFRLSETPCAPCRDAEADYQRQRNVRRAARKDGAA